MKNLSTYVKNIEEKGFSKNNIVVEHRSNNPKRDFLFVNKAQCMHIPNSPNEIISMCKLLAKEVEKTVNMNDYKKILVIGFAETATAIANLVADNLPSCKFVMTTTREDIPYGKRIVEFKEEHSHAPQQLLITYEHIDIFTDFDYILFVEDEISTGKTILNFIDVIQKSQKHKEQIKYGVASICNWQNAESATKFKEKEIDVISLIKGELISPDLKMDIEYCRSNPFNNHSFKKAAVSDIFTYNMAEERMGHAPNRNLKPLYKKITSELQANMLHGGYGFNIKIRVIGTEECKYLAIKAAEYLDTFYMDHTCRFRTICQSTTRSPIDIISVGNPKDGIISKYQVPSLYEKERNVYIYNTDYDVDINMIVTDIIMTDAAKQRFKDILGNNCIFISASEVNI